MRLEWKITICIIPYFWFCGTNTAILECGFGLSWIRVWCCYWWYFLIDFSYAHSLRFFASIWRKSVSISFLHLGMSINCLARQEEWMLPDYPATGSGRWRVESVARRFPILERLVSKFSLTLGESILSSLLRLHPLYKPLNSRRKLH